MRSKNLRLWSSWRPFDSSFECKEEFSMRLVQNAGHRSHSVKLFMFILFALFPAKSQSGICLAWTMLSSFVLRENN